ncbi:hypothetical protein RFI_05495, partial [Reticulomyxa filosa]
MGEEDGKKKSNMTQINDYQMTESKEDVVSKTQQLNAERIFGVHCSCYTIAFVSDNLDEVDLPVNNKSRGGEAKKKRSCNLFIFFFFLKKKKKMSDAHEALITDIQVSKDRKWVASCGFDGVVKIWRAVGKDKRYNLVALSSSIESKKDRVPVGRICWSKNNEYMLSVAQGADSSWNECDI